MTEQWTCRDPAPVTHWGDTSAVPPMQLGRADPATERPLPELLAAIGDGMTDEERARFAASLDAAEHGDGRPAVVLTRHRYVNGKISAKCDYDSAVGAFRLHGGRVDRSTVVAYEDGDEHLGTWEQVWPPAGQANDQADSTDGSTDGGEPGE